MESHDKNTIASSENNSGLKVKQLKELSYIMTDFKNVYELLLVSTKSHPGFPPFNKYYSLLLKLFDVISSFHTLFLKEKKKRTYKCNFFSLKYVSKYTF